MYDVLLLENHRRKILLRNRRSMGYRYLGRKINVKIITSKSYGFYWPAQRGRTARRTFPRRLSGHASAHSYLRQIKSTFHRFFWLGCEEHFVSVITEAALKWQILILHDSSRFPVDSLVHLSRLFHNYSQRGNDIRRMIDSQIVEREGGQRKWFCCCLFFRNSVGTNAVFKETNI